MAGEIVGWVVDGTILCPTHAKEWAEENNTDLETDERASPIFDDSEWDYIPTCEECGDPLDVSPTSDGLRWVAQFDSAEEAEEAFPGVGGRWYEVAEEQGYTRPETEEEEEEEEILAKMRQLDEILEKLFKG